MGSKIRNNKGVFQGIPVSALLYTAFADSIMGGYKTELPNTKRGEFKANTEGLATEAQCPNRHINRMYHTDPGNENNWIPPEENNHVSINDGKIRFSDHAGIAFKNANKIADKLRNYDNVAIKNNLLVNGRDVFILHSLGK